LFKRTHHQNIATALSYFNPSYLMNHQCYFGGGTAIALRYGEFRESIDIDFLISDLACYGQVRNDVRDHHDLSPLLLPGKKLDLVRELRTDQYGIRTIIEINHAKIKLEIISEGRISFEQPTLDDQISGVPALTRLDLLTSKLLVNSDRYADDSVYSRDLIDLAMMQPKQDELHQAIEKAKKAYGDSVKRDLLAAIDYLFRREQRLEKCTDYLRMEIPNSVVYQNIQKLKGTVLKI
jgi:hypothetical protein